jgi:hypothetical protein
VQFPTRSADGNGAPERAEITPLCCRRLGEPSSQRHFSERVDGPELTQALERYHPHGVPPIGTHSQHARFLRTCQARGSTFANAGSSPGLPRRLQSLPQASRKQTGPRDGPSAEVTTRQPDTYAGTTLAAIAAPRPDPPDHFFYCGIETASRYFARSACHLFTSSGLFVAVCSVSTEITTPRSPVPRPGQSG